MSKNTPTYDETSLKKDWERAMNSKDLNFIAEVMHRWSQVYGDDKKYQKLANYQFIVTKEKQ